MTMTVGAVLDWYEAHRRDASPVAETERCRLWRLFRSRYGDNLVRDCRAALLLDFIDSQPGVRSNHTRRRWKATINRPFNAAAELGLIPANPFRGLRIKCGPRGRDWTDAEYRAILRHSPAYFRRIVVFLRFAGARPGEGRGMHWSHLRPRVIVQAQHKTAHTGAAPRRIHVNTVLGKLLAWVERHSTHGDYVFTNSQGRPWTIQALTKHLRAVRKRAGLSKEVKLHGARHTFATHAILNGVDLATLKELLGHASVKTTELYLHLIDQDDHLADAMERATALTGRSRARR